EGVREVPGRQGRRRQRPGRVPGRVRGGSLRRGPRREEVPGEEERREPVAQAAEADRRPRARARPRGPQGPRPERGRGAGRRPAAARLEVAMMPPPAHPSPASAVRALRVPGLLAAAVLAAAVLPGCDAGTTPLARAAEAERAGSYAEARARYQEACDKG